jgi:dTDP-4-amino-4,6-dideoxygalactose transaminase
MTSFSARYPVGTLSKAKIESILTDYFGRRFCCLTNRGTTALTAAFVGLNLPPGTRVVFPAAMCSIPVFSALFAGLRPEFADVNLDDANFDLADLERTLSQAKDRIGAVVPIHMFGRPDNMDALQDLCRRYGAALVEDAALSLGAAYKGKPVGSLGQISCLSFVRKMLPLEMGGAVLTDDPDLEARMRTFVVDLPRPAAQNREKVQAAMRAFHGLTSYAAAEDWGKKALLAPFREEFQRLLLSRTVDEDWADSIVLKELDALSQVIAARRVRAEVYETVLQHPRLRPLQHTDSVLFAYALRLDGVPAEAFLDFAESRGFLFRRIAYPDIHPIFRDPGSFPNAETVEREVIGLPIDETQPVSSCWEYAQDFLKLFQEFVETKRDFSDFFWRGRLERRMS